MGVSQHEQGRRIQVYFGGKQGWMDLSPDTAKVLLDWYDAAELGAIKHGMSCAVDGKELLLTYTIEGGRYLSQQNPRRTDGKRECVVYLAEALT